MRSMTRADGDLTTRARIRDAAIDQFSTSGFAATTVRAIATAAGVSAGLVIHHFGSKDALRQACDTWVMSVFSGAVEDMQQHGPGGAVAQLARREEFLPIAHYLIRVLVDGGPLAQTLFDRIVSDTEGWLTASVAQGLVRPSTDEHARATLLVTISLGIQVFGNYVAPGATPEDRDKALIELAAGPAVELYTHGLFTGTEFLDALQRGTK